MVDLSWQKRLAIVLSVVWLALIAARSRNESGSFTVFLVLDILPTIAFCWGVAWVWSGFRKQSPIAPASLLETPADEPVSRATLYFYLWVAAILLASGAVLFYYAFAKIDVEPPGKIVYLIGFYFWAPILVYVLWRVMFRRGGVGLLLFTIAFLGIACYQSHAMLRETEDAQRLLSKAQTMLLKLMNRELVERSEISDLGQYSSVLLVIHDFFSRVVNDLQALNTKVETSGLETMLRPATLENPRAISEATATLESLGALMDQTESRVITSYDEFPRTIDSADIPYNVKARFRTAAERGVKRGKADLSEYFKIQRAFIATAIQLLEFMKQRQGRFNRHGDQILFVSQAEANKYNEYLQRIQALALQQSEWHNAQRSASAKQLEQMQRIQ